VIVSAQKVGVVLLVYGFEPHVLERVRDAQRTLGSIPYVVVHNPKTDGLFVQGEEVLAMERNAGYAAAMNAGAKRLCEHAEPDVLVFVTQEVNLVHSEITRLAATALDQNAIVGPVLYDRSSERVSYGKKGSASIESMEEVTTADGIDGALLAIPSEAFRRLGGFTERYFMYWEDVDLCRRFIRAGGRVVVDTAIRVAQSSGGEARKAAGTYLSIRNQGFFDRESGKARSRVALISLGRGTFAVVHALKKVLQRRSSVADGCWTVVAVIVGLSHLAIGTSGPPPAFLNARSDISNVR
jgi:GT2 family glycosyltransferase